MARKLTIQVSDEIYDGLQRHVGKRGIAKPWLEAQYREQAADEEAEREAKERLDADLGDSLPDEDGTWLREPTAPATAFKSFR